MKLISTCVVEHQNVTTREAFHSVGSYQINSKQKKIIAPGSCVGTAIMNCVIYASVFGSIFIISAIGCCIYCAYKGCPCIPYLPYIDYSCPDAVINNHPQNVKKEVEMTAVKKSEVPTAIAVVNPDGAQVQKLSTGNVQQSSTDKPSAPSPSDTSSSESE